MYANTLTVIYWYEKIPQATLTVKYVEVDEEDISNGLTLNSGNEIDSERYTLKVGESITLNRKTITDEETGRNYISVDGPENLTARILLRIASLGTRVTTTADGIRVVVVGEDEDSYVATMEERDSNGDGQMDGMEVRFYYERQYKISAEVEGGNLDGDYTYEIINRNGNNTKEIVARPASTDYELDSVKINGLELNLEDIVDEEGAMRLGAGYFTSVTEDKKIALPFRKIQTKVITKYIDIDTNEEIIQEEVEVGDIGEEYAVTRKTLEGYEKAGEEPTNSTGLRTKEDIIVTYYYGKVVNTPNTNTNTTENTIENTIENTAENEVDYIEEMHTPRMSNIARQRKTGNVKTGDKIFAFVSLFILSVVGFVVGETHRIQRYGKHKK